MIVSTKTNAKSCGCGCAPGCDCTCNSAVCASTGDTGFTRPNFFAGQLLTDEDLQAVLNYVVDKNRLHNKHFYGEGVVCGLEVKQHPCESKKVVVRPGHALDCCGNDIVVSCPEEIDILKMVHDLRTKLKGGYDCGDPCAEPKQSNERSGDGKDAKNGQSDSYQKYCLYVRYDEKKLDLVTPFDVGDACNPVTCMPSRIRESYCFELRCPPKEDVCPHNLCSALKECDEVLPHLRKHLVRVELAAAAVEKAEEILVKADELKQQLAKDPVNFESLKSSADSARKSLGKVDAENARTILNSLHTLVTMSFRALFVPPERASEGPDPEVASLIQELHPEIKRVLGEFSSSGDLAVPKTLVERLIKRNDRLELAAKEGERAKTFDGKAAIVGDLVDAALVNELVAQINVPRNVVIQSYQDGTTMFPPTLYRELTALPSNEWRVVERLNDGDTEVVWKVVWVIKRAIEVIIRRCYCDKLLPPCPPCEDTGVLLACIYVSAKDCEVRDVCSLDRCVVVTGSTLRYWFGGLRIWDDFHSCCCPEPQPCDPSTIRQEMLKQLSREWRTSPDRLQDADTWQVNLQAWQDRIGDVEVSRDIAYALFSPASGYSSTGIELHETATAVGSSELPLMAGPRNYDCSQLFELLRGLCSREPSQSMRELRPDPLTTSVKSAAATAEAAAASTKVVRQKTSKTTRRRSNREQS